MLDVPCNLLQKNNPMSASYYINRVNCFNEVLKSRLEKRVIARLAVDDFIKRRYGIECFTHLVHTHLPLLAQNAISLGQSVGVLARQVPGICAEDVAMYLLCRKLGLLPLALSFTRDTFVGMSHDKRHRVNIPWVELSKKDKLVLKYEDISKDGIANIERRRLDSIVVKDRSSLIDYHKSVRQQIFNDSYPMDDVSRFHGELLARATINRPDAVYRDVDGKDTLTPGSYSAEEARTLVVRPPAGWYYPLYLSMFVTGELILLDTYENPEGNVFEAKALFERTMGMLVQECGFMPMVIQTTPLCLDMMFCNRHILATPHSAETLCDRARLWHTTTYDASRHFADLALMFRG